MNDSFISYLAWVALGAALVAWVGVAFFAWTIMQHESEYAARREAAQQAVVREDARVRARALAQDTESARTHLEELLNVDVVSAVDVIETAGKAAKVAMELGGAESETNFSQPQSGIVKAVGFGVSGQGTFPSLMHAIELFETLPLPSTLERFDLQYTPGGGKTPSWHLDARVRVLTTAQISS